ncbi:MAG: hypothetical protein KKB50_20235 [Planctomycetes bacterium]|nr:hypothetical protein [Planctomycetota bacterium]
MMRKHLLAVAIGVLLIAMTGCVTAPERIDVRVGNGGERVDSSRVPATASHEEARQELHKAYRYIQQLERRVEDLKEEKAKYKHQRDDYKDRLKKYEDD